MERTEATRHAVDDGIATITVRPEREKRAPVWKGR